MPKLHIWHVIGAWPRLSAFPTTTYLEQTHNWGCSVLGHTTLRCKELKWDRVTIWRIQLQNSGRSSLRLVSCCSYSPHLSRHSAQGTFPALPKSKGRTSAMEVMFVLIFGCRINFNLNPDIEDMLKTIAFIKGHKWTTMMVKRTYFGNWLRDYSQAVDVGSLQGVNAPTIRILVPNPLHFRSL
jgi:hypothetical protein